MLISEGYRNLLLQLRQNRPSYGSTAYKHAADVRDFAEQLQAKTILDYGCGAGTLGSASEMQKFDVIGYDPAVKGKEVLPEVSFDVVACIDVMEHVEESYVTDVLEQIYSKAQSGVYLLISLVPAKHILPNGENAHITLYPAHEWFERLTEFFPWRSYDLLVRQRFLVFKGVK